LEAPLVFEGQVGQAVEAYGGLAAAGASLDHHQARAGARDELELPRIDQRGNLRQVLLLAPIRLESDAELAGAVVLLRPHRRALPATQARRAVTRAVPHPGGIPNERPLG